MSQALTSEAPIYLDYAATTPLDPRVLAVLVEALEDIGNPASITHDYGRRAARRVEAARGQVAALISTSAEDVVFTSGATESINLAVLGSVRAQSDRRRHVLTSRVEHRATLDACRQLEREGFDVEYLVPDRDGVLDPDVVVRAVRPDTALVSLMHVNNEIGVVQDLRLIAQSCRARGVRFHVDAAQSAGKLPLDVTDLPVDFLSFTAHKICGPKGIGALYVAPYARPWIRPLIHGGGQERGLRSGTLPTHQIAAFGAACEIAAREMGAEAERVRQLRERLWRPLASLPGVHLNGHATARVPGILNVSFEGLEGESLISDLRGLAVATGSACSSAAQEPSYVLRALGRPTELAQSSLRFSLGRFTTETDVDRAAAEVARAVTRLRQVAP